MVPHHILYKFSMEELCKMFPHHVISEFHDSNWLPRSLDFSGPNYFLWGYLKSRVFETCPATLGELKANIREAIHDVLQCMMDDFNKHLPRVHHCGRGTCTAFCFQKMNSTYIKLNFQDICYMLMCQFILFTQ
jgi:hypothetical protein